MAIQFETSDRIAVEPDLQAVYRVGEQYKLGIPKNPIAGGIGGMMGSSAGSSLEFHDFREYVPGDDPRHIDWSALGRSDQLMVRLYREEVAPFTDLLVDGSRSMEAGDGRKGARCRELALAFDRFAQRAGAEPAVWLIREHPLRLDGSTEQKLERIDVSGRQSFERVDEWRSLCLRRRSIRVVISDFLFVHHPDTLVKQFASGASALWLLQLLDPFEAHPAVGGGVRLVDVETDEFQDLILNDKIVSDYSRRLANLQTGLADAARRAGARFQTLVADRSLNDICRYALMPAGAITAGE